LLGKGQFVKNRAPVIENALEGNLFTVRALRPLSRAPKVMAMALLTFDSALSRIDIILLLSIKLNVTFLSESDKPLKIDQMMRQQPLVME
jgi:hypothetical protein